MWVVRDCRGATFVEYLVLCGCIALMCIAGFRVFAKSVLTKIEAEARCLALLEACMDGAAPRGVSAADPEPTASKPPSAAPKATARRASPPRPTPPSVEPVEDKPETVPAVAHPASPFAEVAKTTQEAAANDDNAPSPSIATTSAPPPAPALPPPAATEPLGLAVAPAPPPDPERFWVKGGKPKCVFDDGFQHSGTSLVTKLRDAVNKHPPSTLVGDETGGHVEVFGYGQSVGANYRIDGQQIHIEVTHKPFILPCGKIGSSLANTIGANGV